MKLFLYTASLFSSFVLSACTTTQKIDPEQELVKNYKPHHWGPSIYGKYGEYSYNLYPTSVEILALSPDLPALRVDIFDTDSDGKFDSVWIIKKGKHSYCSTKHHPILINSAGKEVLRDFIGLAHAIREKDKNKQNTQLTWSF